MRRAIYLALIFVVISKPAICQQNINFISIDSFVASLKEANVRVSAEGDLMGKGRQDWAGIVAYKEDNNEENVRIYILQKLESGSYSLVEKSASTPAFGGTGNFGYEDITINAKSLIVTYGYHWHECAGNASSQFKLMKDNWRLIGVESFETNKIDGSDTVIESSTNLLTGKAIVKRSKNENSKVFTFKVEPKPVLFKDYSGQGTISMHEKAPVC
jgi:hypothetical protein